MNRKTVLACLLVLMACSLFAQKVTLKVASIAPGRSQWDVDQKLMAQEILKATGGDVTFRFYDITTMGGEKSVIQKMRAVRPGQKAAIDGAVFTNLGISELAPDSDIITLCVPFLFKNDDEIALALKSYPHMAQAIDEQGFELLGWFSVGWATFFTKEPVKTLPELKKLKLSVGTLDSPAIGELFQLSGFNTFDIPKEKLLQSTKSADGIQGLYSIPMYAYAAQYSKNLPYVIDIPICPVVAAFVVSKASWAALPLEYQKTIRSIVVKYEGQFLKVQNEVNLEYMSKMELDGNVILRFSDSERAVWEKAFSSDIDRIASSKKSAINYTFYQELQKFLADYRAGKK